MVAHLWAAILGVVQGLAEFLPISSSAHLALIPQVKALHVPAQFLGDTGLRFDIALHLGSGLAILVALWSDWKALAVGAVRGDAFERKLVGFLLLTSIPGAIFGALLDSKAEEAIRNPLLIAATLAVMGVVLWLVDKYSRRQEPFESMTWGRSLIIGVAQAIAIIPGVSRSGITITAGRALGFSREAIARYSFMAALPIIVGAALFGLRKVPLGTLFSVDWAIGFAVAFVASVVAMRVMLEYVKKHSFLVFAIYRFVLAALVVALVLGRAM